jgi:hypothetical protein
LYSAIASSYTSGISFIGQKAGAFSSDMGPSLAFAPLFSQTLVGHLAQAGYFSLAMGLLLHPF